MWKKDRGNEYENAEFVDGKIYQGKWKSCLRYKSDFWDTWYVKNYEGIFGDYDDFDKPVPPNKSKVTFTFPKDDKFLSLEGVYEYRQHGRPGRFGYAIKEIITGTLKRTEGLIELNCEFVLHDGLRCYEGDISFAYDDGLTFKGFLTGSGSLEIDGVLSWKDGTTYPYNGEWSVDKITKLKKRLDIVNKRNRKEEAKTKPNLVQPEKIKSIKEYNPEVAIDDKKPSTKYEEKELVPINME